MREKCVTPVKLPFPQFRFSSTMGACAATLSPVGGLLYPAAQPHAPSPAEQRGGVLRSFLLWVVGIRAPPRCAEGV